MKVRLTVKEVRKAIQPSICCALLPKEFVFGREGFEHSATFGGLLIVILANGN